MLKNSQLTPWVNRGLPPVLGTTLRDCDEIRETTKQVGMRRDKLGTRRDKLGTRRDKLGTRSRGEGN